jgi:hypothetical protein
MATKMLRPNVGIFVATSDAFGGADITASTWAPTLAQLTDPTKVFNISAAITDDYTLNMTDSDTDSSLAIVDSASVSTPTLYNYEASLDAFRDANPSADSAYNLFKAKFADAAVGTKYYLIKRIGKTADAAFALGDLVSVYGVTTDYAVDLIGDGEMIRIGARFLTTGELAVNVATAAGTAGLGPTTKSITGTKLQSNGNLSVYWVPTSEVADETAFLEGPTDAQINSGVDLTAAIAFDGYNLGASESNKIDDKGIADKSNAQSRGFAQFSGSLTFFRGVVSETTGAYADAFDTFKGATDARVDGFLVTRIGLPSATAIAASQKVSVYKFIADSVMDNTEGEDSVKFMVNFQPQGQLAVNVAVVAD